MVKAQEIRGKLVSYLANGIDLDLLEDWLVQNSWNIGKSDDLEARQLVFAVELRLSEYSSGHLLEPALRHELSAILASYLSHVSKEVIIFESGASNFTSQGPAQVEFQWQHVDTLSAVVSESLVGHQR